MRHRLRFHLTITNPSIVVAAPVIDSWALMGSPTQLLSIFAVYLIFVLKIGPKFMRDRKPFNLESYIRCYNIFQIVACAYFVRWGYYRGFGITDAFTCKRERTNEKELLELWGVNWSFIMLRLIELSETVVFVLRKKQNQVSTLHVYHHLSTVTILWLFQKYSMNEMGVYACGLNSFVHIVMYSYYFLTSFKSLSGYMKIVKPLITIIQLVQLVLIFGNNIVAASPSCNAGKLYYLQLVNMIVLIGFFAKFYSDSYVKPNKKEA